MAKSGHSPTEVNEKVSNFLKRIGALNNPLNHIVSYNIAVSNNAATTVTVTLIIDEHFGVENG